MKYDKNPIFTKELLAIQKSLASYQKLYGMATLNSMSKSLMQFQSTISKQLNTQAAATTLVMQQALNNQMSASIMQLSKMVESYNNLAKSIGSSLNQVAIRGCAAKAKALASCINLNQSQTFVPGVASGILTNKNIDDDVIVIPNEIAKSISDTLGISNDELEPAIPYKDSKKVSIEKLTLWLSILGSIITILTGFFTINDHFSGKSTEKYQHQMLQEEHKQTELLEKIHIDLQKK